MSVIRTLQLQRTKFGAAPTNQTRRVMLRGTTTISQWFSPNFYDVFGWLRNALTSAGFDVIAVRTDGAAYIGYANNVEIELNVYCQYDAEQVRQSAIGVIESVQGRATAISTGLTKVFNNTTLAVSYDQGCTNQPTQNAPAVNPSAYDQTNQSSAGWNNFWQGIGIATPPTIGTVALIAGAYLLLTGKIGR